MAVPAATQALACAEGLPRAAEAAAYEAEVAAQREALAAKRPWVDVNKGDSTKIDYRSRMVGR